ncbi:methyltransferase domain-containing protein [Nonomuraea sp. C10]|uniref:methyltransferase domain-containing protein n=1 Tax=Nonomuraea sp. C10 TaxID=2600577 RepID=UPI0011CE5C06|nr:methyltransferase domain-containing protein [Nonomuraea sp. C10]TXK39312.1 methyltransferase domain-containing protein [Nonomuraea sp. C10]
MARSVRGIEPLVAAEIRNSRLGRVSGLRHREVWFEPSGSWAGLTGLRTADDVLLVAAVVDGVGPARAALRRLAAAARTITYPGVPAQPGIEVSASFVGRRNYTRFEIEDAVGAELARRLGSPYHSRSGGAAPPGGCVAWRVTIEGDRAVIAVRIAGRPLHRRPYKTASIRGTLHPPLAAAMAGLARLAGARTVLDPCCGAGTTLIEAAALAPQALLLGLDHDPAAIAAARENARHAENGADGAPRRTADLRVLAGASRTGRGTRFRWGVADAGRVPVAGGSVDRVLVNPPWGRQVPPAGELAREPDRLWREIRRVLARDGLVVALSYDEGGDPPGFETVERVEVSLSGRHPVLAVLRLRERRRASRGRAG